MADAVLSAELKYRDGQRQRLIVSVGKELVSVMNGVKELNANVSQLLTHLVEQEKARGSCTPGEEDEEDTDEDELSNCDLQCPAKRLRNT